MRPLAARISIFYRIPIQMAFNKNQKWVENIHKKKDGSYYVVSANKASPVTL